MAESLDSRTAAFNGKRALKEDFDEGRSANQKRVKSSTIPGTGGESKENDYIDNGKSSLPSSSQPTGVAPSINWNTGIRAKIRTTLGGAPKDQRTSSQKEIAAIPLPSTVPLPSALDATSAGVAFNEGSGDGELSSKQTQSSNEVPGQESTPTNSVAQSLPLTLKPGTHIVSLPSSPADSANDLLEVADDGRVVVLNLVSEDDSEDEVEEYESGEVHDSDDLELEGNCYIHDSSEAEGENEDSAISGLGNPMEDAEMQDATMSYSKSNPGQNTPKTLNGGTTIVTEERQVLALRELDSQDFELQLRYFYVACDPRTIDYNNPVRCFTCAKDGHTSDTCSALTCSSCGVYGDHFRAACPKTRRCEKCRERGHAKKDCPYKLGRLADKELECDLCKQVGHVETDCELVWRTSGPWETEIPTFSVRLACYECGKAGHLGNDCPTRNPKKPMGSSTWTFKRAIKGKSKVGNQSGIGISIKGRAEQMKPIEIDDSEDERANFHRPRIPLPTRIGQVHVASDNIGRSQGSSWTPANAVGEREVSSGVYYSGDLRRRPPSPPKPVRIGSFNTKDSRFKGSDTYTPNIAPGTGIGAARSKKNKRAKRWAEEASRYRPMPGSAQNAWKKHRT